MSEYDPLALLQEFDTIGVKPKHVCGLIGIPESSMSRAKTGAGFLQAQDILNMKNLLRDCKELARRNILPVNWTDLRVVRRQLDALHTEERNPPPEPSSEDLDIFQRFAAGEDLDEIAIRHKLDKAGVLGRVEAVLQRAAHLSRKVTAGE